MSSKTSSRPRSGPPPTAPPSNGKQPNAWSRPLQPAAKRPQKVAARPPPGMGAPPVLRERFLHLTLSMVGQKVVVTCTDGSVVEGIFHTFTPFSTTEINYVLRACHGDGVKQQGATVILDAQNVAHVSVKSMRLDTNNNSSNKNTSSGTESQFQTDVQISATRQDRNRDLVAAGSAWTSSTTSARAADAAPKATFLKGDIGGWDQFKANEQLFNVQATFDENLYTTKLDPSQIDARKKLEAARLAREIETTTSSNIHLKEERGQAVEGDYDEEDLYSGVLKPSLQPRNVLVAEKSSRSQQQQVSASKKEGGDAKEKEPKTTTAAAGPKKMNYAAAAAKAKADANKAAVVPPGFVKPNNVVTPEQQESGATNKKEEKKQEENGDAKVTPSKEEPAKEEKKKVDDTKSDEKKEETKKPTTKLNANAKSFSFNPGAKSFTPTFGGVPPPAAAAAVPQYDQYPIDPSTGMPFGGPGGALPQHMQPQYMPHPGMGQPGMVQMMNPHYAAAMRYQGPYPGMEHQMPMPVPHQPQHMQQQPPSAPGSQHPSAPGSQQASEHGSVAGADSPAPPMTGDDASASDSAAPPPSQQQQQQQQIFNQHLQQMPYPGGPPGNYYHPGMMPRGAPGGYPPQAMAHPPGNPYMHPMYAAGGGGGGGGAPGGMHHQMPPNMMRQGGPPGSYYPPTTMGVMHYPPGAYGGGGGGGGGMMEDDQGGYNRGGARGVRSGGARGGGPRRGSSGRKNRGYSSYSSGGGSGRQTPQSVTSGMSADAGDTREKSSSPTEEKQPKPSSGEE